MRMFKLMTATLFLIFAIDPQQASAGTYNVELAVRNTIADFETALEKRDQSSIQKLVAADVVVVGTDGVTLGWVDLLDKYLVPHSHNIERKNDRSSIERVEISCDVAWVYSRKRSVSHPGTEIWTVYILKQKSHAWKISAWSWGTKAPASH
jgi:hypothetical protein